MALSDEAKRRLELAAVSKEYGQEIATAIDSGSNPQASSVSALGTTTDIGSTDGSGGAGDAALAADVESRLDAIEAKVDEVIAALKAAGLMAS